MSIKPEVAEEILGFIGIESAEDLDTFKTEFNSRFVPLNDAHNNPEIQKKVVGKRMTEITSKLTDFGKSVGLDVSFDELAKKKVEDVIGDFKSSLATKITELSEAANSGSDKRVHDLAKQLEEKDKSLNQFKSEWEKTANEFNAFKEQSENSLKAYKVNHQLDSLKSKINWVDDIKDVHRAGFNTIINSEYRFELGEGDKLVVKDKDGNFIPNKNKAGAFADPFDVLVSVADLNGLVKKNNADNSQKKTIFANAKREDGSDNRDKKLSPAYLKRVQQLNGK